MGKVVMLVEDDATEGATIKQWVETSLPDVKVLWYNNVNDAEVRLREYRKSPGSIDCVILDMFFPSLAGKMEAMGQAILREYPQYSIILISKFADTRAWVQVVPGVPLFRLEKPVDWTSMDKPTVRTEIAEFRRQLVEAVQCAIIIGGLRVDVERLSGQQIFRPFRKMRTLRAAIGFLLAGLVYGISIRYLNELSQHIFLAVVVVMGVHLLDRAVLFRDYRDELSSIEALLAKISVELQQLAQQISRGK